MALPNSKATSLDTPSLTHIFNHTILSSCFTLDWKMTKKLFPVHKKGPQSLRENYTPISILSAISKLIQRITNHLYRYFNENAILSKQQLFRLFYFWI